MTSPLCPISIQGSPVALLKFQMAPKLTLLLSSGPKKEPRYVCLSEARASHSHRMWAEVSSSAPHLLHNGLSDSPIRWRCLPRVLCPVRRPVTTLDCVLLKDRNLPLAPRQVVSVTVTYCISSSDANGGQKMYGLLPVRRFFWNWNNIRTCSSSFRSDRPHAYIQGVQIKSGPYFNISNLFTTCYITQLTWIYSKCWKWYPFISMHLSTRFTMFLLNHFRNSTFYWRLPSKIFNKTLSTVDVRHCF
jgi:hypothetical protein